MQLIIYSDDLNAFAGLWDPFLGSKDPPEQTRGHQFISIRVFEFAEQKIYFANPSKGLLSGHGSFPLLRTLLTKRSKQERQLTTNGYPEAMILSPQGYLVKKP